MTYPDNIIEFPKTKPTGLQSVGLFVDPSREADKLRKKFAGIGMQWYHQCQSERVRQERQWYLNYAFFSGNQHVEFRQTQGGGPFDLYVPKAPYYRVRIVVNQVRRIIRKEISRLTAQKPNAFVVPASTEDADVFAAQAGEQIWDSLWRRLKFNKTLREAVFWQAVCGNGFIKSGWDATKKDPDSDMDGDISIYNVTPFHVFVPDLMCTEVEDEPYIIHAQVKNNSWIKQNLGIDAVSNKLESVDEGIQNIMGVNRNDTKKDQSIILEIWVKPGHLPDLPNGGMFTIAAEQVVQGWDQWPYDHGQYPLSKLDSMPTGKFYTSSIIEDLIPLQKELNRSRSQLIESKNRMSKPQLAAQKGAVDAKKITTEPGLVVEYAVGFEPPTPIPLQNLPSYVTEEINRLYSDMSDISGQHDVSNGSTPPGVTAATAISFLQEQDESLIATHFTSIEEAIEKVAGQSLSYVKMFWDEPRTVKIVGLEGTFDVQTFKNSDLRGNSDIRVESGSALPTSRAAKQAFIMDLMKMGFIQSEEGLETMEIGGLNRIYERIQVDKRQAQRENLKMRVITDQDMQQQQQEWMQQQQQETQPPMQTQQVQQAPQTDFLNPQVTKDTQSGLNLVPPLLVPVNTYDNHEIHIKVHNDYRKSQNFESASTLTKALFEEHVKQHMEASMAAFTGQLPVDPNSLPSDGNGEQTQTSGPVPMPDVSGEQLQGGQGG